MAVASLLNGAPRGSRLLPMLVTLLAIALFSVMDALMKRASMLGGVYAALFARSLLGVVVLGPVWRWRGGRWPDRALLRLHLLRGLLASGMAASFFYGVVRTPLAEGIAISFIAPLLALGLAALLLGEAIRRMVVIAALVSLAGVGVIAWGRLGGEAPTGEAAHGIAAILVSAVLYAWNLVVQRQQAQLASPLEVAFSQNAVIGLVLLSGAGMIALLAALTDWDLPAVAGLVIPPASTLPDIAGSAVLASASLMLLAWAYARAEAQTLVPLEYTAFIWSAVAGWLWFAEAVTLTTLAGLALILAGVWLGTHQPRPETADSRESYT